MNIFDIFNRKKKDDGLVVLSLFDGISCGQVALDKLGIPVKTYYASEIDKAAIRVTQTNYPSTIQLGDVRELDPKTLPKIDLLIGGSPCQDLSIIKVGHREGLQGQKSSLFYEYIRILKAVKPKYFLLENVAGMKKSDQDIITSYMGVEPVLIDSNCFSAQERKRLYWTNLPVDTSNLKESKLCLKDILEKNVAEKYFYNYPLYDVDMSRQVCAFMDYKNYKMHKRVLNPNFKSHTLTTAGGGQYAEKSIG
jgi:DNA-cytosine methyltransferase